MAEKQLTRIMYVEDEPDIQEIARLSLEKVGGFTVEIHASGEEALARGPAFEPDMILLDAMMPGMDGLATLASMRSLPAFASTPVVFMTAKVQAHEIQEYLDAGAIDVISKPFDPMALPDRIREIWDRCSS